MPVIAVIGDGQLARMMQTAAIELGQSIRLLAGAPDSAAAQVAADVIEGDYTQIDDLRRAAAGTTAVTFDHEHVPNEHLDTLIAEGINVQPTPQALLFAQDKLAQRTRLSELGCPVPDFAAIRSAQDARDFYQRVDGAVCLKACRGGYDGHGVWFPETQDECAALVDELLGKGVDLLAERKVAFDRELSAMVARTPSGQVAAWPVVESVQKNGVCAVAIAPAPDLPPEIDEHARSLAMTIAGQLEVTGVMAVELFETHDDSGNQRLWINELAMRPHNTGHWTQDGCVTSQFEQHLRAVADLPLGTTAPTAPATVMVNVLGAEQDPDLPMPDRMAAVWARFPHAHIHLYGKGYRPGRKLGHVNVTGTDAAVVRREAELAAHFLIHAVWADGYITPEDTLAPTI